MNPYLVLGVPTNAEDPVIRAAYLDAIKQASPDTDPRRFQAVSAAYEKIKNEPSRLRHSLFDHDCPGDSPLDAWLRYVQSSPSPKPLPLEAMKELLRSCART